MFISGKENNAAILNLIESTSELNGAIAFIGSDALEILRECQGGGRIVCNLKSGGTNPYTVESLRKAGKFKVKQEDSLHAKVYIGDNKAIVSSANLSANGLGLENDEITGWIEAGVVVEDAFELKNIANWFEVIWTNANQILDDDLALAKANWEKRRINRPSYSSDLSVLEILKKDPSFFENRNVYLVFTRDSLSCEGEKIFEETKSRREYGHNIDVYEGWSNLPENSYFIDMYFGSRGKFVFYGINKSPDNKIIINFFDEEGDSSDLFICTKMDDVYGLRLSASDKELLKNKTKALWDKFKDSEDNACLIPILEARSILFAD